MSALDHYRAPASGLVLADTLVPLDPWRCRWFGHRLRGRYEREPSGDFFERTAAERGERFYEVVPYPSKRVHPSAFECVWCERCGREWKRVEARQVSNKAKEIAFDSALARGNVRVFLDPSHAEAILPSHLRAQSHIVLEYGRDLVIPIPDLDVSERGVRATLSFGREPVLTFVPWGAVFLIEYADGCRAGWPDDAPKSMREPTAQPHPARGLLTLIKGGKPS